MTVDPDGVIKRFNILKNKPISMPVVQNIETVEPFAYSAESAHPFRRNGAPFRFKLSSAQIVN